MNETYHLVDAQGVATPLSRYARPGQHGAQAVQFALTRAYGYATVLRADDGAGSATVVELKWTEEQPDEASLEGRLRMLRAAARTARFLTRAGRSALAVSGGALVSTPVADEGSQVAQVTLSLAPASITTLGTDGGEVVW